ncbi:ABC transporter ATP-binding protein [Amycolatopsis sp. NPDC059027]|uniref:ABC transporter ATP-binding protein n=1 Tax=Amycolatopsis sp. NPDC059027 TaxID=3346709 RepID=UPI00366BDE27
MTRTSLPILRELGRGPALAAVMVLSVASAACTLAMPLIVADLISAVRTDAGLVRPAVLLGVTALGGALAATAASYLLARMGERLVLRLRVRLMAHILRLPLRDVRATGEGDLVTRVTADSLQLRTITDLGIVQLPVSVLTTAGTLVIMGLLDWVLLVITVAAFLVAGVVIAVVVAGMQRAQLCHSRALGELGHRFATALAALPVVKASRAERQVTDRLGTSADETARAAITAARLQAAVNPVLSLGQQIALVAVIIAGGARLAAGSLDIAGFAAFLLYLMQLIAPVIIMVMAVGRLQAGLAARSRFTEVLDQSTEDGGDPVAAPAPLDAAPAVRFQHVEFAHGERPVLRGIDFEVPRRGLTALVGPSGAGKTTALSLVERFVTADAGRVEVLGRDVTSWPVGALRSRIAYVDQSFTLLADTVRANLTVGLTEPMPDARLLGVLGTVGLREHVTAMPDGLDTELGRVADLSGGQRQRLALARTLLSEAEIVLLDEPTSQLDGVNESLLRDVVDTLAADRAVLVVAHRLSTIRHAARVVLLEDGRVTDLGGHDELLDRNESYRALAAAQRLDRPVGAAS